MNARNDEPVIDWGAAVAAKPGESVCGDAYVVAPFEGGCLVAVVDGLGHGPPAEEAASAAIDVVLAHAGADPASILEHCHERLRSTRGAVMTLASFDARAHQVSWLAVGNVEGVLFRALPVAGRSRAAVPPVGGVVGYQIRTPRTAVVPVSCGDILVLASDGVRSDFDDALVAACDPQRTADQIVARYARATDDACVLVARYIGRTTSRLRVSHESDVVVARNEARELARAQGWPEGSAEALAIAVSEVTRNVVVHAGSGEVLLSPEHAAGAPAIVVIARDEGPGIADVESALHGRNSHARGLGVGLAAARDLVDDFAISTRPGGGTTVALRKRRP